MKKQLFILLIAAFLSSAEYLSAHPGSGIAVDLQGMVYFVDTGKGLWKLAPGKQPELVSEVSYHFMGMDRTGAFANSPNQFGQWFERATPRGAVPAIIECSDFPMAIGRDGNIYYADTRQFPAKITRRTPEGTETVIAEMIEEPPPNAEGGPQRYVTGITVGPAGFIYVVESAAQDEYVVIRKVSMDGNVKIIARSFVPTNLEFQPRPSVAPSAIPAGQPIPMTSRSYCRGLSVAEDEIIYVAAPSVRSVLKLSRGGKVEVVLTAEAPWAPTDVAIHDGEIYVLEYDHTGEDRINWLPRVRKVDRDGKTQTLATIARN